MLRASLVDVVLLPMEGGVGLDDDALAGGLLEFVDEAGLAGLECLGNLGMDAQGDTGGVEISGHLASLGLDFIANGGQRFDHARAGTVRARLAEDALKGLLGALAGDADQAEFIEIQGLGGGAVGAKGGVQRGHDFFAVAALLHVNEIEDDDAAEIAQANLADDFLDGLEVGLDDGVFQSRAAPADVFAGVDVDSHESLGVVDDDVATRLEPDLGAQGAVELLLDAELLENGRGLGVELDAVEQARLKAADELGDLAELLLVVNPDGGVVVADVVAQDALDQ